MFKNESPLDFAIKDNRDSFELALTSIEKNILNNPLSVRPIIAGKEVEGGERCIRENPANVNMVIANVFYATVNQAKRVVEGVVKGQNYLERMGFEERINALGRLADIIKKRRLELASLIVLEVGKPWQEADADVVEAIDFCNYYAEEANKIKGFKKTQDILGENNFIFYAPRGVALVISPWNFPLAIACGMTVAALVAGNGVILKPAEQSSAIAKELALMILEAGFPPEAFAFLPGRGEEVGAFLVEHPAIDMIVFTGSKEVGLQIIRKSSFVASGQRNIKKVVAEMGGKNCIIVDEDADLDEVIKGVLYSAFGFSGQKCSACSRVITVGDIDRDFLDRIKEGASNLIVGNPRFSETFVGPLVDLEAKIRVEKFLERAKGSYEVLYLGEQLSGGHYVPIAIFRNVPTDSSLWRRECFAPILACRNVDSFDIALNELNDSEYALTGGIYSRNPSNIDKAYRGYFEVGNLYINRGITGAIVGRQPFGGFKMSGIGSKAGGADYLMQFVISKTITENTMRRGFTPDL